jgi:hypothetical protein
MNKSTNPITDELQGRMEAHRLALQLLLQHNPAVLQAVASVDPNGPTLGLQLSERGRQALREEIELLAQTKPARRA